MIEGLQEAVEVVAATAPATALTIQAAAAAILPAAVQLLKLIIPSLEGRGLLWANLALNVSVAVMVSFGMDVPLAAAAVVGFGGGLAGSKLVDLKKRGAVLSDRHRRR